MGQIDNICFPSFCLAKHNIFSYFFETGKILISSFGNRLHALPHVGNIYDNLKNLIRNVLNTQDLSIYGSFTNNIHLMGLNYFKILNWWLFHINFAENDVKGTRFRT